MKTLRFALIAAILSFAMITYAADKKEPVKKTVKITLVQAYKVPGLVTAMRAQLSITFLKLEQPGLYSATVRYNQAIYVVVATRAAWIRFFLNKAKKGEVNILQQ